MSLFYLIYYYFAWTATVCVLAISVVMLARLILVYADPNPFGALGRFSFWLRKQTDDFVRPSQDFLGAWRLDRRLAPLLVILAAILIGYFAAQFAFSVLWTINGVAGAAAVGSALSAVGYLLSGSIGIYSFLIFLRILSTWFLSYRSSLRQFLARICDPVLLPFQRLIPPIGVFDISPILVMILLSLLQNIVARALISEFVPF
jgi:YggT family protein